MIPLRKLAAGLLVFAAAPGFGCLVWEPLSRDQSPRDPKQVLEQPAIQLQPGDAHSGELDCKAGRCDQWFRVRALRSGTLRVEAQVDGLAERALARLFLQDGSGNTLARALSSEGLPLRVESPVEPGAYALLIHVGGGPVHYALETRLEERAAPAASSAPAKGR